MNTILIFLFSILSFLPFIPKHTPTPKKITHTMVKTIRKPSVATKPVTTSIEGITLSITPVPTSYYYAVPTQETNNTTAITGIAGISASPTITPTVVQNQTTTTDNSTNNTQTTSPSIEPSITPSNTLTPTPTQNPCYLEQVTYTDSNGNCHPGINPTEAAARAAAEITPTPTDTPYQYCLAEAKAKLPPGQSLPPNVCGDL